jgi:beta-N-acetylhexosaminidase
MQSMISQMIVVGFSGYKPGDKWVEQLSRDVQNDKIGGIYIARDNIKSFKQLKKINNYLQKKSAKKLLVLSYPYNFSDFKDVKKDYNLDEMKKLNIDFYKNLKKSGINMLFWPNADLHLNSSYSEQEDVEVSYIMYELNSLKKADIVPVIGHFPGKVNSANDWKYTDLKPYFELVKYNKIKAIMMNDDINIDLDNKNISTFSHYTIKSILRDKLKYEGLVISADLKSKKITKKYSFKKSVVNAINAGNDILFFSSYFANKTNVPREVKRIVLEALKSGKIQKSAIEESYKKILEFRKNNGID